MLDDTIIVQSAISAFNNAALWAPAFLWYAILALPVFVMVFLGGDAINSRLGWVRNNILDKVTVWIAGLTFGWIVLMGGNYGVLRDSLSVLPLMMAAIVFLTSLFVSSHMARGALRKLRPWGWLLGIFMIIMLVMSDMHVWWGPLLQVGALLLGWLLGYFAQGQMRPVSGCVLIMLTTVVAILMQPEFFRFGQLGNLTLMHLGAILLLGCVLMMAVAVMNIKPCGKIRAGVFVKLKWLMRVVCVLGAALFILTEAVPVFLGTLAAVFVSVAMSVWHAKDIDSVVGDKLFALGIVCFGVITVMPAISILGILYWVSMPSHKLLASVRALL